MTSGEQPSYTLISVPSDWEPPTENQIKEKLEKGNNKDKNEMLEKLILMLLNGDKLAPSILMHVIRFCLLTSDHKLKKNLLLFWEVVPKTDAQGKLLREMILVCDAYRKDLQHPNEFVRGSTLRFLCKLKEPELLDPLMPSIRQCLEHNHSYVRKNAICAIFTIYKNFEFLIPDAPELAFNFLEREQDASCKRNAFMMLLHVDQARALDYLSGCIDNVTQFNDILQLVIVELIYKVCHANPAERSRFIRCVYNLLKSNSAAVKYEAAGTLVTLSSYPAAIREAASTYIELIVKESDNNVKLIVLDRLMELRQSTSHEKILQELVMDILRVLSSPGLEVRQKTLSLALDLVSSRNVEEMVAFLKKEINKSSTESNDEAGKYRQELVKTLHVATIRFPDVAPNIIPVLMDFLSDDNEVAAKYVLDFVREAVHKLPALKESILKSLQDGLLSIKKPKVFTSALWILGSFSDTEASLESLLSLIKKSLGELPIVASELNENQDENPTEETKTQSTRQLVTADGTYATQSALVTTKKANKNVPPLRQFLLESNFFIGAQLATIITKMVERFQQLASSKRVHEYRAECLYILSCIVHLGKSGITTTKATEDDLDRMCATIKLLALECPVAAEIYLNRCQESLDMMLVNTHKDSSDDVEKKREKNTVQVDKTITFSQLTTKADASSGENMFDTALSQALGTAPKTQKFDFSSSKLEKVVQLSGFSDPVYAEAYVNVNQYDIVLDVLIINQTADTLQNVSLELCTDGDLKLVDKPSPITLAPSDFANIKATVKVASTENGIIYSTISYDVRGSTSDRNCVYLQDIKIDIMDYIIPGSLTDEEFRKMWFEFEWENKVSVNTTITGLREFIDNLSASTNMRILTGEAAIDGECGFLAANLAAHSIFGEDALANVSIEKSRPMEEDSPIIGHIRIRAKSQGMALTMGDKVKACQVKK